MFVCGKTAMARKVLAKMGKGARTRHVSGTDLVGG